jgi:hypothetical protein
MIGINLQLNDANGIPLKSLTDIHAVWWDEINPTNVLPSGRTLSATTDDNGFLKLDLTSVSTLVVGEYGFLKLHLNNELNHHASLTFSSKLQISDIDAGVPLDRYFLKRTLLEYSNDILLTQADFGIIKLAPMSDYLNVKLPVTIATETDVLQLENITNKMCDVRLLSSDNRLLTLIKPNGTVSLHKRGENWYAGMRHNLRDATDEPFSFKTDDLRDINTINLSDDRVLIVYRNLSDAHQGGVSLLQRRGNILTLVDEILFETAEAHKVTATKISDTQVLVSYRKFGTTGSGVSNLITIINDVVSIGTLVTFETADIDSTTVVALSSTKAIVLYTLVTGVVGKAVVLTIAAGSIVVTPSITFANSALSISAVKLTDTKLCAVYKDGLMKTCVMSLNDTTLTVNTASDFTGSCADTATVMLTDYKVLTAFRDALDNDVGIVRILSINDTNITVSEPTKFSVTHANYINLVALDAEKAAVIYSEDAYLDYGTVCIISVSGDTVAISVPNAFNENSFGDAATSRTTSNEMITVYRLRDSMVAHFLTIKDQKLLTNIVEPLFI